MSKPLERDDDFVMYLNSGDKGSQPLEPGVTTVRSAFRQELEIPLTLSQDWQVALYSLYYTHSFGNAVLKSSDDYHCQVGALGTRQPLRSIQLSRHKQFTHVKHVLQDLIQQLGLYVIPTLSGGKHHYGQLHMASPSSFDENFPVNPKLDYFRRDLMDGWLATYKTLPTAFLGMKHYLNQATTTLMGADRVKYVWTLIESSSRPSTHYALDLWAQGRYDLGESLALLMGFIEVDPDNPGHTRIVAHNEVTVSTGRYESRWVVARLDTHHIGISDEDYLLGGVSISLNIDVEDFSNTFGTRRTFDVGAWLKDDSPLTPYTR